MSISASPQVDHFNARAIQDEVDIESYCLNCIKKHAGITQTLLLEVQQRLQQQSPVSDYKVLFKMGQVFENVSHIELHCAIDERVSLSILDKLNKVSTMANEIRNIIKTQKWALVVKNHVPDGDLNDIIDIRSKLKKLQHYVDEFIVKDGCGSCNIKSHTMYNKAVASVPSVSKAPIVVDRMVGKNMYSINNITNSVFKSYSGFADGFFNSIGLNGSLISSTLFSALASQGFSWIIDTVFNPGYGLIGEILLGGALMYVGSNHISGSRASLEWTQAGANLFAKIISTTPSEWSQAFREVTNTFSGGLSNPGIALNRVFRNQNEINNRVRNVYRMGLSSPQASPSLIGQSSQGSRNLQFANRSDEPTFHDF